MKQGIHAHTFKMLQSFWCAFNCGILIKKGVKKDSNCAIFPLVILLLLNFSQLRPEKQFKIALDFYGNTYSEFFTAPWTVKYFIQIQFVLLFNCPFHLLQDLITDQKWTWIQYSDLHRLDQWSLTAVHKAWTTTSFLFLYINHISRYLQSHMAGGILMFPWKCFL